MGEKRGSVVYDETPKPAIESMSVIKMFRKLLLLFNEALFLVEFELWNHDKKLSFPNRVSLVTRRRFKNNGEGSPIYARNRNGKGR